VCSLDWAHGIGRTRKTWAVVYFWRKEKCCIFAQNKNNKIMATITLDYDENNRIAKKTIDFVLSLGVFKTGKKYTGIEEAEDDIREGRVYKAKNVDDLFEQILK
jgi:hypothetical protein